jgi:hypothetical protein
MNAQRVFACGVDPLLFKRKHQVLSEENQARLERVARRVGLTARLRYEMGFRDNPLRSSEEDYLLRSVELSSIEVYLLCTCLDTLAGRPRHKPFRQWVAEQPDVTGLDADAIADLYDRYQEEYGVGRNLRALFSALPLAAKEWLADNVAIHPAGAPFAVPTENVDELIDRLYRYFYDVRRNAFTHEALSLHTPNARDIGGTTDEDRWTTPVSGANCVLYRDRPSQKWDLSYREGLDEATILRVIIHTAGLRILQIEPTNTVIETNLRNYSRIDGLYAFLNEVARNSALVNSWGKLDHPAIAELHSYLFHVGVPQLSCQAAGRMVGRYLDNTFESGLRGMTREYVREVDQVNFHISEFNEANPPGVQGEHAQERCRLINQFLDELVETRPCKSVMRWPSIREMSSLWLIIRDPCYAWPSVRAGG